MSGSVTWRATRASRPGRRDAAGLVVIHGDASSRCGISMKGVDIVVRGSVGHMSAFMAQKGRLVVCGDAGDALGDSIYEARLYVDGTVAGLGADCVEKEMREEHVRRGRRSCSSGRASTTSIPPSFRRYGSARELYNFNGRRRRRVLTMALRESALFSREVIAEIQRAAREGRLRHPRLRRQAPAASLRRPPAARARASRATRSRATASAATRTSCSARATPSARSSSTSRSPSPA